MMMPERVDVRSVDRSKLHSLEQVKIDTSLPCEQRIKNYVEQIGNPYCYLDGDIIVSLGFSDTRVCLKDQLKALASSIG